MQESDNEYKVDCTNADQMHEALTEAFKYKLDTKLSTATHAALVYEDEVGRIVLYATYKELHWAVCHPDYAHHQLVEGVAVSLRCVGFDYYVINLRGSDTPSYGWLDYKNNTCCIYNGSVCTQSGSVCIQE